MLGANLGLLLYGEVSVMNLKVFFLLFLLGFVYLYVLPFVFFLGYFLIKHRILFAKFARVDFECIFHLFLCCSFLNLKFFLWA